MKVLLAAVVPYSVGTTGAIWLQQQFECLWCNHASTLYMLKQPVGITWSGPALSKCRHSWQDDSSTAVVGPLQQQCHSVAVRPYV